MTKQHFVIPYHISNSNLSSIHILGIMKQIIDVHFFPPGNEDDSGQGTLYIQENDRNYLETNKILTNNFEGIPVLFAVSVASGEKYTLVNSIVFETNFHKIKYQILELYKGSFVEKATEEVLTECEMKIGGLTGWLNQSWIEIQSDNAINTKKEFVVNYQLPGMRLQLKQMAVRCYDKNQVTITNDSKINLIAESPSNRLTFLNHAKGFINFLALFTRAIPKLHYMDFTNNEGETIEFIFKGDKNYDAYPDALLQHSHLQPYLENVLRIFYTDLDNFSKVMDLYVESIKNQTVEISFLNLAAALEIFHKTFMEKKNEAFRENLIAELIQEGILEQKNSKSKKWSQTMRYYDLFKFMDDVPLIKREFQQPTIFSQNLTASRNYYTHWEDRGKAIWYTNDLVAINNKLRSLVRAIVLKQLGIPATLINKLVSYDSMIFFNNFEKNEYSINYRNAVAVL